MADLSKLSKEQLAEEIMDVLGLSLDSLNRMTKSDLMQVHKKLLELKTSGEIVDKPLSEILDEKIGGKPVRDMTLGEIAEQMKDQGPLGLGILPDIRRAIREELRGIFRKRRRESGE